MNFLGLTLCQTSPGFPCLLFKSFENTLGERESLLAISPFFTECIIRMDNFLSFSSNIEWSSAKSFSLEESKICCLGKGKPVGLLGEGCINPFPNKPWFFRFCNTSLLNTLWEKEKLIVTVFSV